MNEREIRGYSILAKGDKPQVLDTENYLVKSQSGNGKYRVSRCGSDWSCECPDYTHRRITCKHIHTVMFWLKIKNKRRDNFIIPELEKRFCPYCKSDKLIKRGIRKNRGEPKQRYSCKRCGKRFVVDVCSKFKGTDKTVTLAMDLYFKGISLRKIKDHLKQFHNIKLSHVTIYYWITKCMKAMNDYVAQFKPELGDIWQADEQYVKARNKEHEYGVAFTWNILDADTRFLIANKVTEIRSRKEAKDIFKEAEKNARKTPEKIITDKLHAYGYGIREGFSRKVEHERYAGFIARTQNNKVERYHNTFRERDKVMRGFKSPETANIMAEAFRTYYNFLRPHQALNGLTPSQMAGINLNLGQNRMLGLLKKSI